MSANAVVFPKMPGCQPMQYLQEEHQHRVAAWEASSASQEQQMEAVRRQLAAALQDSSASQAALHALQQEATQQVGLL